jgi:two-component system sensor histidine kinase CreC
MRRALEGRQYVERYVQTLTHEIKSPLAAIQGAAELLQEDMPAEQRAQFLKNIRREAARVREVVDRLLELASIENRDTLRDVETFDLADLVDEVATSLAPQLRAKSQSLHQEVSSVSVRGERFLVRQAMANLVQNAIDFSPEEGSIDLAVARDGTDAVIRVTDAGPGVPEYALQRAFERFYSLPRPDTGSKSTGLGLAFVLEVAQLHGGSASLANRMEEPGAEAALRLPCGG